MGATLRPTCHPVEFRIPYYRPKRSFGQGNIFTSICLSTGWVGGYPSMPCRSVPGGVVWSRGVSNFLGGLQFFWGSPIFWRGWSGPGGLQFFRGVSNFLGVSNFSGVSPIFGGSPIFRGSVILWYTGWERLIRSHSLARFCFELSGNSN